MSKSLEQIQEENRRQIIMACNSEAKSYEEALEKYATEELLDKSDGPNGYGQWIKIKDDIIYKSYPDENDDFVENDILMSAADFAFRLLTLDRVLLAITSDNSKIAAYFQNHPQIMDIKQHNQDDWDKIDLSFRWVLTHKTLEEQTEHSQKVINKILMGNE